MPDDDTHRVVGGQHRRGAGGDGPATVYEPGDTLTPSEAELRAFPFRFERLPDADAATTDTTETDAEPAPSPDDGADASDSDDASSDASVPFTADEVADAEYQTLRGWARDFEDIDGNWGADRLRTELTAKIEED